jgi:uncharacterized protein
MSAGSDWLQALRSHAGAAAAAPRVAPDPVNLPMIRRWCEAIGERNPLYLDEAAARAGPHGELVAPPAMLEVWTMGRFRHDGQREVSLLGVEALDRAGFTSVVATNLEQEYLQPLRLGDRVTQRVFLEGVSDEKRTALGTGHFLSYRYEFTDQAERPVGRMRFRILKFRPETLAAAAAPGLPAKPPHPRPSITRDSEFFWDGLNEHRLLVRRCSACGHLHHPPGPLCPQCHSSAWAPQPLRGRGIVHSFVVVHQPQLPGFDYPLPVVLVELEEGVRLVGNLRDVELADVAIGLPVEAVFVEVEPGFVLYAFRPRTGD